MQIKHKHIVGPGRRYQDSRHLLQNLKVSKNVMGLNNYAQRSTQPYYLHVDNPLNIFWPYLNSLIKVPNTKCHDIYVKGVKGIDPITKRYPPAHTTKQDAQNLNIFSKRNI